MSFRLLPVLIFVAALTLTMKVSGLWHDLTAPVVPGVPVPHAGDAEAIRWDPPLVVAAGSQSGASGDERGGLAPASEPGGFEQWNIQPAGNDPLAPALTTDATGWVDETVRTATLRDPYEFTNEEIDLLQQLSERREEIDRRGREMDQREALLAAAEERVEQKVAELEALRRLIEDLVNQHDAQEESQLRSLVKIYENMKPKEAARIFEELDMVILLEVVDRMKERKAAPVLARLSPDRAKEITLELAKRRNLPVAKE